MAITIMNKNVNDREILFISDSFHLLGCVTEESFLVPELVEDLDLFLLYLKAEPAKSVLKSKSCLRGFNWNVLYSSENSMITQLSLQSVTNLVIEL